jgi:hypothetical protein
MKTLKKNIAALMAGLLLSAMIPCYLPEDVSCDHHISLSDVMINAVKAAESIKQGSHQLANLISTIQMVAELKPILRASNDNNFFAHGDLCYIIPNYDSVHIPACFRLQQDPLWTYTSYILPPKTPPPLC